MTKTEQLANEGALRFLDLAAVVLSLPIAWEVYEEVLGTAWLPPLHALWPGLVAAVLLWGASAWIHRLYEAPIGRSALGELDRPLRAIATHAVALTALGFLTRQDGLPRLLVGFYVAAVLALVVSVRVGRRLVLRAAFGKRFAKRYAVVGTGGMAREVVEAVEAHPEWGMRFAGFVGLGAGGERSRGPNLGPLRDLGRILDAEVIDVVVFAVARERLDEIERAVHVCEEQGVEVRISLDVLRFGPGRMMVADMDGIPMLAFARAPTDAIALAVKRAFDVAVSAAVLVVLSPLLAAISLAVKLESQGPVLFAQRRVGMNGREFWMVKFRSMFADAEARLEGLRARNEMSGPVFKMKDDPRVTRVGRFLRRTSLDELPQFWNVLKGEMSVVGPRPPIPAEVRQYKRWQRRRLSVRPGITCIWQISGRNEIDFERWMELDLEYIDSWSLRGDLAICLKTIPAVLGARGAR